MGILNISRANFLSAKLAEHIGRDINQRYTVMPGRFSLAQQILNNPLLQWMRIMDEKYSGWLDILLPSMRTGALLPQLFSRLREEIPMAPLVLSWFDRDWLHYMRSHGMYLPESVLPEMDRISAINKVELPLKFTGMDLSSGITADSVPQARHMDYRLPYTSPAMVLTGELVRRLEAMRSNAPIQPGHTGTIQQGQAVQFPVSEKDYLRIFSLPASAVTSLPAAIQPAGLQHTGVLPLPNVFPATQPISIEQAVFNKYVAVQPGVIPRQVSGSGMKVPQPPSMTGRLQDLTTPVNISHAPRDIPNDRGIIIHPPARQQQAARQQHGYQAAVPGIESAMPLFSAEEDPASAGSREPGRITGRVRPTRSSRQFDYSMPAGSGSADLPLPEAGADFDLYSLSYNLPAATVKASSPAMPGILSGTGSGGPAFALPHAPAAFIQKKPSAPEVQQDTQEQSPARPAGTEATGAEQDIEALAAEIYEILRRRIAIEQERLQGSMR